MTVMIILMTRSDPSLGRRVSNSMAMSLLQQLVVIIIIIKIIIIIVISNIIIIITTITIRHLDQC